MRNLGATFERINYESKTYFLAHNAAHSNARNRSLQSDFTVQLNQLKFLFTYLLSAFDTKEFIAKFKINYI